jgi:hypothetical protein
MVPGTVSPQISTPVVKNLRIRTKFASDMRLIYQRCQAPWLVTVPGTFGGVGGYGGGFVVDRGLA